MAAGTMHALARACVLEIHVISINSWLWRLGDDRDPVLLLVQGRHNDPGDRCPTDQASVHAQYIWSVNFFRRDY